MRVAYPRIVPGDRRLAFHEASRRDLIAARFGLCEPRPDAPPISLDQITAFVIPGIAFDRAGGRIGWGRGYYDATLEAVPAALRIGLAFECQLVDHIAREPHDIPVNYIVTEVATYAVE
jgi:5-formyltetrahydrofolate cyclo-ligase